MSECARTAVVISLADRRRRTDAPAEGSDRGPARIHDFVNARECTRIASPRMFYRYLDAAVIRDPNAFICVCVLRISDFAKVGARLSDRSAGTIIRHILQRIARRAGERGMASRLQDDEFAVYVTSLRSMDEASLVANKIMDAFAQPFAEGQVQVQLMLNMGVAVYPLDGADAFALTEAARSIIPGKLPGRSSFALRRTVSMRGI